MVNAKKLKTNLKYHLSDSTAMLTATRPFYSLAEKLIGMTDQASISAMQKVIGLTYFGLGRVFSGGRDLSRKVFKITDESKERVIWLHDSIYASLFTCASMGLIYTFSEPDNQKVALGTAIAAGTAVIRGPIVGYAIDVFRDLTGLKECKRRTYPKAIRNLRPGIKKCLAASLVAISISSIALIYSVMPDKKETSISNPTEQTIQTVQRESQNNPLERLVKENLYKGR